MSANTIPDHARSMSMTPLEPRQSGGLKGFGFTVIFEDSHSVAPPPPGETDTIGEGVSSPSSPVTILTHEEAQ